MCVELYTKRHVLIQKMCKFNMFITAVCFLFLIKLRWPKNKQIYDTVKTHRGSLLIIDREDLFLDRYGIGI